MLPVTSATAAVLAAAGSVVIQGASSSSVGVGGSSRGAFILLEGVDRCGKTTQCQRIYERFVSNHISVQKMNFPNRTTPTGILIDQYLQSSSELDDRAIHLLFSANRWESANEIMNTLLNGTTIICDRYAYSGVAFSSAKVKPTTTTVTKVTTTVNCPSSSTDLLSQTNEQQEQQQFNPDPVLSMDWCMDPDRGLPAPDCIIFLDIKQEEAEKRGGYGNERYEKKDMQIRVRKQFQILQDMDDNNENNTTSSLWTVLDATETIEQVEEKLFDIVQRTIQKVKNQPVERLWEKKERLKSK